MNNSVIFRYLYLVLCMLGFMNVAYAQTTATPISFFPNVISQKLAASASYKIKNTENKIVASIKQHFDLQASQYAEIKISVIYNEQQQVKEALVYLLSASDKSFSTTKVIFDDALNIVSRKDHYHVIANDLRQTPAYNIKGGYYCPDPSVQFVIANNFANNADMDKEVNKVYQLALNYGYYTELMTMTVGSDEKTMNRPTVEKYRAWLQCKNIKGFYSESYGAHDGLLLADGLFLYEEFYNTRAQSLNNTVLLLGASYTFHDPFLSSILDFEKGAAAKKVIGGFGALPFGASEKTAACFWAKTFKNGELSQKYIAECAMQHDMHTEAYLMTGNGDMIF